MLPPKDKEKMRAYADNLAKTGEQLFLSRTILRADALTFRNFWPLMEVNITTAANYSQTEKSERSSLFIVEGKITKIRDF